jgi:ribosome-associated protein
MKSQDLVKLIAEVAADKKATRIIAQNLEGKSGLCDYQIVVSGSNERQTQAIATHIEDTLRERKIARPFAVEGKQTGHWILMDYDGVLVHIFLDSIRDYYAMERLWPDAATQIFADTGLSV